MSNTVIYNDGELELKVPINNETVWVNRNQLSELFDRDVKTIGKHINNVFKEGELNKFSVIANFATTASDGKTYNIEYYNLDVIISIGYRVKSQKGVKFRQWATSVLKQYIQNGYTINTEKITNERFVSLENEVISLKDEMKKVSTHIKNNTLELKQGIFYNGEIFDAYVFISDLIKSTKSSIILIDNYIDESTLTLFSKNQNIAITIYTQNISKQLKLDIEKYNKQYKNLSIKTSKNFHDRFMIIDKEKIYHIGASLKDLGNKTFAFSAINLEVEDVLANLI